jgi:hypothetical protein
VSEGVVNGPGRGVVTVVAGVANVVLVVVPTAGVVDRLGEISR